jgi:copper resistance protein C
MSRKTLATLTACALLLASTTALAHTMVRSTTIAEGATLATSPPSVTVTFEHAAGVGSVKLTTITGETILLSFTPSRAMVTSVTVPLPRLDPDRYKLEWRAIAQDGHVMAGGLNFGVTGAARPAPAAMAPKAPTSPKRP